MTGSIRLPNSSHSDKISTLLEKATTARTDLFDREHYCALRLFNGFTEGCSDLVVDLYGTTVVLHDYSETPEQGQELVDAAQAFYMHTLPWLKNGIVKTRNSRSALERKGRLLFGTDPDRKVKENGIWYAIDLVMHRDASLYLDTRNLRLWAYRHLQGRIVLNAFAYTGSLGVAALAGGASRVVQLDLNRSYLNIAKTSYTLNGLPVRKADFLAGDFWVQVSRLKRSQVGFDCVFLDPPFFSSTPAGTLDLNQDSARLINKVRPLVNDGGWLVAINNALYISGKDYLATLESLCQDGYLKIAELIPVPRDFTGFGTTRDPAPITDPAPFNHSTKIAVLEVRRKNA